MRAEFLSSKFSPPQEQFSLRPQRRNHVWSYDFVEAQTHDGRRLWGARDDADVMLTRGVPEYIRSEIVRK